MRLTRNKLVSKKRSTQFARQLSSEREKLVEGVPVTHLTDMFGLVIGITNNQAYALVPTHARQRMDGLVNACPCPFIVHEGGKFLLYVPEKTAVSETLDIELTCNIPGLPHQILPP